MGSPKALLEIGGRTFLELVGGALAAGGCHPVVVVVGTGVSHQRAASLAGACGWEVLVNPEPDAEQIDSLRLALLSLEPEVDAAVVSPVDVPGVGAELVRSLVAAFRRTGAPLVIPLVGEGRHGHPVLFGRPLFAGLLDPALRGGARGVVHAHLDVAVELPVACPSELDDVDTPEDYARRVADERG
jgi:CTP:molybdopterin cytidylyltransferase MocA